MKARCVILLQPDIQLHGAFENLFCIERDGSKRWTAALPETHDAFVEVRIVSGELRANSWSGYLLTFNRDSGQVIHQEFVK
jgi:hypothetical protein